MLEKLLKSIDLQNVSKMIGAKTGAVVGVVFSALVINYGLPPEFATVEIQTGITAVLTGAISGAFAYFFPANKK